jgi:outer membrane lipoprotein SlyB
MFAKYGLIPHTSIICTVLIFIATSTSAQNIQRSQLGSAFEVRYGRVELVDRVKIESQAAKGAVMGGLIGGATSGHHHRGKHALEGALAGAFLTAILEGNRKAYQYTVDFEDGSVTKVVTETSGIVEGDCVAVELGRTANIRRTSTVYCEHRNHEALADPIVHAKWQSEAAECHASKQMALQATTAEATDIALKKVRVFCEN